LGSPPFRGSGDRSCPLSGANRLPFAGSAKDRIPHFSPQRNHTNVKSASACGFEKSPPRLGTDLTTEHQAVILNMKRALPADGWPQINYLKEVTALCGWRGGYFFLLAIIKRPIMPTTKMPVWIRSEYVTIGQPPFLRIRGQKLPPVGGQPPAVCWQRQGQNTTLFSVAQPYKIQIGKRLPI
jgi:hypothetical protein